MPPVVAAVAVVAKAVSAGGVLGFFARAVGGFVLNAAASKLMPKPKVGGVGQVDIPPRTVSVREPVRPREMVYGFTRKGGTMIFLHSNAVAAGDPATQLGTAGSLLHIVIVLAAHRVKSIGAIYFDGEMAIDANGVGQGRFLNYVTLEKHLGHPGQAAFPGLRAAVPSLWTENHRLEGCAGIYLRLIASPDVFPNGIPSISADVEGKDDILDPRTGLRGYTRNAALCVADYMAHPVFGIGAQIGAEDGTTEDDLIESANICEEIVPVRVDGGLPEVFADGREGVALSLFDHDPTGVARAFTDGGATAAAWGAQVQQVTGLIPPGRNAGQGVLANRPRVARAPVGGVRNLVDAGRAFSLVRMTETVTAITVNGEPFRRYTETTSPASAGQRYFADAIYNVVAGRTYIVSMRAIGGEGRHLAIGEQSTTNNFGVAFNLDTGAVGTIAGDTNPVAGRAADGRYWLRFTANTTQTLGIQYRMVTNPAVSFQTYTGDGVSGFWVGRISFEEVAANATGPSPEQIRLSAFDITEPGAASPGALLFDGSNDAMEIGPFAAGFDGDVVFLTPQGIWIETGVTLPGRQVTVTEPGPFSPGGQVIETSPGGTLTLGPVNGPGGTPGLFTTYPRICGAYAVAGGVTPKDLARLQRVARDAGLPDTVLSPDAPTPADEEPRYTCDGVLSLGQSPKINIEAMLTAMAGKAVYSGGSWRIMAGAYRVPTLTLTADDVREAGFSLTTRVSKSDNFNGVRGQFVSPENDWQPDDFPAYQSAVYVAEDRGDEDWLDINLPFTTSAAMAQRLARIELERQRRQQSVRMAGKLKAWAATAGETVMMSYDRWGFAEKPFEVRRVSLAVQDRGETATLVPDLELRETSPLVYSWDATEQEIYAAAPRTTLPSPFDVPTPGVPVVSEDIYETRNGAGVKALARLIWTPSPSGFLSRYEIEGALDGGPFLALGTTTETRFDVQDVKPGAWVFRVRAVTTLGVRSAWVSRAATIVGLAAPPVAITGLTLQSAGGLAILKWDLHPDLDVRIGGQIVIRHARGSTGWANSVSMETLPGATALAALPLLPGTYYVAARDSSGIVGPVAAVSSTGAQVIAFSPVDLLRADPTFPGGKDGVAVGDLGLTLVGQADWDDIPDFDAEPNIDTAGGVVPSGTYTFGAALDFGAVARVRLRSEIVFNTLALFDDFDARTDNIDTWADFDGGGGATTDVRVDVRLTNDDPAGSPDWTDWARLDSSEITARAVEARAVLTTDDAAYVPVVTELRVSAEEVA